MRPQNGNLFRDLALSSEERFEPLLEGGRFRLVRIVSSGQATPAGEWYDQDEDEWVVLLRGHARLRFEDQRAEHKLRPGDWLLIPAHRRHRVEATAPDQATLWLALHAERPQGET